MRKAPNFPETVAAFAAVNFDIALALTDLHQVAQEARKLRSERNALQGDYLAASDDVQLNTVLARKLIGQIEAAVQRALASDPALGRKLRARIPAAQPGDAIRDVRAALRDRVDQLIDAVPDVTSLGLSSSFLLEAAVVEDHYAVRIDGAVVASSARANHTRKLHAALDQLGSQIRVIEAVCVQMENTSTIGVRPPGFDQGILAAASHAPQTEISNTAGLPPLPPEVDAPEHDLPPLGPMEET